MSNSVSVNRDNYVIKFEGNRIQVGEISPSGRNYVNRMLIGGDEAVLYYHIGDPTLDTPRQDTAVYAFKNVDGAWHIATAEEITPSLQNLKFGCTGNNIIEFTTTEASQIEGKANEAFAQLDLARQDMAQLAVGSFGTRAARPQATRGETVAR